MTEASYGEEFLRRYQVRGELGSGMSGVVLLAEQRSLGRLVAVKYLRSAATAAPELRRRFDREARVLAELSHPNLVAVYDSGFDGDIPYLVEEFLTGGSLADALAVEPVLDPARAVELARRIADGLGAAHAASVLHRDLKPANVLLAEGRGPVIVDFGLATALDDSTRLTRTGYVVGTVDYMAPEQLMDGKLTPACDVYALGIMLFEMLSGGRPFPPGMGATLGRLHEPAPSLATVSPTMPRAVVELVDAMLSREPEDRPPDGAGASRRLAVAAEALDSKRTVRAPAVPLRRPGGIRALTTRLRVAVGRARLTLAATLALLVLLLTGLLATRRPPSVPPSPPPSPLTASVLVLRPTSVTLQVRGGQGGSLTVAVAEGGRELLPRRTVSVGADEGTTLVIDLPAGREVDLTLHRGRPGDAPPARVRVATPSASLTGRFLRRGGAHLPPSLDALLQGERRLRPLARPALLGDRLAWGLAAGGLLSMTSAGGRLWYVEPHRVLRGVVADGQRFYAFCSVGVVTAHEPLDGSVRWTTRLGGELDWEGCLVDDLLIVRYREGDGSFVALDRATGAERWRAGGISGRPYGVALPAGLCATGYMVGVFAFDPATGQARGRLGLAGIDRLSASPLGTGREVVLPLLSGLLVAGPPAGPPRLSCPLEGEIRDVAMVGGLVVALCQLPARLAAVDLETGEVRWSHLLESSVEPRLWVAGTRAAVMTDRGDARLSVLDPASGLVVVDVLRIPGSVVGVLPAPDGMLVLTSRGELHHLAL